MQFLVYIWCGNKLVIWANVLVSRTCRNLIWYFKSHNSSYLLPKLAKKRRSCINLVTQRHLHRICYWRCSQKHLRCRLLIFLIQQLTHFWWALRMVMMVNKHFNKLLLIRVCFPPTGFSDLVKSVKLKAPSIIHTCRTEPNKGPGFC